MNTRVMVPSSQTAKLLSKTVLPGRNTPNAISSCDLEIAIMMEEVDKLGLKLRGDRPNHCVSVSLPLTLSMDGSNHQKVKSV